MIITIATEMIINFIRGLSSPLFLCLKEEIMKKYYVAWNYKSSADEIAILILDEINDILKKYVQPKSVCYSSITYLKNTLTLI